MNAADAAAVRRVLPVRLKRLERAEFARAAVEQGPAVASLLASGASGLGRPGLDGVLAVAQVAVCGWVLFTTARAARSLRARPTHADSAPLAPLDDDGVPADFARVDWTGVAASALILVELAHRWRETGRLVRPFLLSALFTLFVAFGGRRVLARRLRRVRERFAPRLILDGDGFDYRGSRRRRFAAAWRDVIAAESSADRLTLRLRDGRAFVLRADDHVQGAALVAAMRGAMPPGLLSPAGTERSPDA